MSDSATGRAGIATAAAIAVVLATTDPGSPPSSLGLQIRRCTINAVEHLEARADHHSSAPSQLRLKLTAMCSPF